MINRFIEIVPGRLYRGSAPTPEDVLMLKNKFGINKIISLDKESGDKIDRSCKMLNIKHVMIPIDIENVRKDLMKLFKHDIAELLLNDGPTFVHCHAGKDRTGLVSAIFECRYLDEDPEVAIERAKELGFGVGIDPKITRLFERLIRACKPENETKDSIVSKNREYISDNKSSFLQEGTQGSFAPHLSHTRQFPMDGVYNHINDQSPTREKSEYIILDKSSVPLVGMFNNDAGVRGFGPVENAGGFFYD